MPNIRKVAKKHLSLSLTETSKLLKSKFHEHRLTALIILVGQYSKSPKEENKKEIVDYYLKHADYINNWDLVDSSAHKILGPYLQDKDRSPLYQLAKEDHLWKQRIAIMSTFHFIINKEFEDTLNISDLLINHKHDLIHKAVGWMLREIGKRSILTEKEYLKTRYKTMPRTMLRYAIEKFPNEERQKYLKGLI
jgi:3-methyladenine DNA glycosylase AlkD